MLIVPDGSLVSPASQFRLAAVALQTPDRRRAVSFYTDALGMVASDRNAATTELSTAVGRPPILTLTERVGVRPSPSRSAGLFHIAFLFPDRSELARTFRRLLSNGFQIDGAADHGVSEALYLSDADGNGVELYADRPSDRWPRQNGSLSMVTEPLDLSDLLESSGSASLHDPIHHETTIGHIHLRVTSLSRAEQFYSGLLGLDVTQKNFPGALFLGSGGYHHHIGVNVWQSQGGIPLPEDAIGLTSIAVESSNPMLLSRMLALMPDAAMNGAQDVFSISDADGIRFQIHFSQPITSHHFTKELS